MFTLSEALEEIKGKTEFKVIEKGDYIVIDYNLETPDTFLKNGMPSEILINLRGTAFSARTGEIVSLPFHKFRNLNETSGYMENEIDFDKIDSIMMKLDGSMIRPIETGISFVWGTRAGETDVSAMVDEWLYTDIPLRQKYRRFVGMCYGLTPIFEFTSRRNKVVIDYAEPQLTLLAIRNKSTGAYLPYHEVLNLGKTYDIPVVQDFASKNVLKYVKEWKDAEGVVVALQNGFRFKMKADAYVTKHRAKDLIRFNKDVVRLILEGKLDDVLPLVDNTKPENPLTIKDTLSEREHLEHYRNHLLRSIDKENLWIKNWVDTFARTNGSGPEYKKIFAEKVLTCHPKFSKFMFRVYDGKTTGVTEYLLTSCSSSTKIKEALNLFGISLWSEE